MKNEKFSKISKIDLRLIVTMLVSALEQVRRFSALDGFLSKNVSKKTSFHMTKLNFKRRQNGQIIQNIERLGKSWRASDLESSN